MKELSIDYIQEQMNLGKNMFQIAQTLQENLPIMEVTKQLELMGSIYNLIHVAQMAGYQKGVEQAMGVLSHERTV